MPAELPNPEFRMQADELGAQWFDKSSLETEFTTGLHDVVKGGPYAPDTGRGKVEQLSTKLRRDAAPTFSEDDLRTMFGMFDVTRRGEVSMAQTLAALRTILGPGARLLDEGDNSEEYAEVQINREQFVQKLFAAIEAHGH
ncbi:unnamed protein product [Pedinophyceae sp. YPF-701]|nr:unnamed protein product [Pedinophyceae sp. YPF-701]